MRRIILFALVLALTVTPCHALTFFKADYDGNEWTETVVYEGDWLPLRKLSEVLPYEVEWSEQERTIYIYAERTWEIKPDWYLPEGVKIENGVTYVSPAYLRRFLPGKAFLYDGELYVYGGETKRSRMVRGDETFRRNALTTLYRIKLALPEDYRLIRRCLTGGIEQSAWQDWMPEGALSYVYPGHKRPTAYIIAGRWANLTELIAHEAYHVYLTRRGRDSEDAAQEYGRRVANLIIK